MTSSRQSDRAKILEEVEKSIQQNMPSYSRNQYIILAREYGVKYGVSEMVEDWLLDWRNQDFHTQSELRDWANTLP